MEIHPTAIVSKKAKIHDSCIVGPFSIIGDNASVGAASIIGSHCVIEGHTEIGSACRIFTGACLGVPPQDLKYRGEKSFLIIGNNNIIREYCTFNPGTGEGGKTIVGNNNLFMAYSHVAHDCIVGNDCVIANNGTLAGHVTVEDKVVIGGLGAVHQFARVGTMSIVGGCSKAVQDVPPYSTCDGHPARFYGLNLVGLRRYKVLAEAIKELDKAFALLFSRGTSVKMALKELKKENLRSKEVLHLISFIESSERGIISSCRKN